MVFHATLRIEDRTALIRLTGELSAASAPELNAYTAQLGADRIDRLVLLMSDLVYMSSAGLRCLVFAHQKMGPAVQIVLVGTRPEVAETIRLTGLDRSVVMQEGPPADSGVPAARGTAEAR